MERDLVISSSKQGIKVALLENKQLVELHTDDGEQEYNVGDIYLGRIKKINPGLNAAFVDVGYEKDGFLHYTDLGPQIRTAQKVTNGCINKTFNDYDLKHLKREKDIVKTGKMNNVLSKRYPILVQVAKEPISTKGPRLTSELSIAGRFLILIPFGEGIGVSKKIPSAEERKRLGRLIESIAPKNCAVVVRTVAQGKGVADLHEDLQSLIDKWKQICKNLRGAKAPSKILAELDKTTGILRDLLNDSFNSISVNDKAVFTEVKNYISRIAPGKEKIVSLYSGRTSIFDAKGITHQIKSSFGKTVTMKSGAYLVIEHTEAMHVIDVNSGNKMVNSRDQENNVLNINLESVNEVARQARLRDMGGLIIIDLIDMRNPEYKRKVLKAARDAMKGDRAQHTVLPISKFGLMQITRQRVKPEMKMNTTEVCPTCNGTGKIEAGILVLDDLERGLAQLKEQGNTAGVTLIVHPFIEAYLKKGFFKSVHKRWKKKYGINFKLLSDADYPINQFRFVDQSEKEIKVA